MKKFRFTKSELMENGTCLLKEDGFISNGFIALKENFVCVNKSLNANFYTLKEFAEATKMLLNPAWNTLGDVLQIDNRAYTKVEIAEKSNNFFTYIFIGNNDKKIERRIDKKTLDKIMAINSDIELYADSNTIYSTKLQIVLNNEVIGVIVAQC